MRRATRLVNALNLTAVGLEKLQADPLKITNAIVRRCERYMKKRFVWLDKIRIVNFICEPLPLNMRDLIHTYIKL